MSPELTTEVLKLPPEPQAPLRRLGPVDEMVSSTELAIPVAYQREERPNFHAVYTD